MRIMTVPFPWDLQRDREWRALFEVSAYASLPANFSILGSPRSSREFGVEPDGRRHIFVSARYVDEDLESAYFRAHDLGEELADRLALLSLAGADITVLSVTYSEVQVGAAFEIAIPIPDASRSAVAISVDDLA